MEKYGIPEDQVTDLIKLGMVNNEDDARKLVASGKGAELIKEAQAKLADKKKSEEGGEDA